MKTILAVMVMAGLALAQDGMMRKGAQGAQGGGVQVRMPSGGGTLLDLVDGSGVAYSSMKVEGGVAAEEGGSGVVVEGFGSMGVRYHGGGTLLDLVDR